MNSRLTGARAEDLAAGFIRRKGFRLIERNYRTRLGEIDIVAIDGYELVFVEVRSKTGPGYGTPAESLNAAKKRKLAMLAEVYRQQNPQSPENYRIDIVSVWLDSSGNNNGIDHLKNAVETDRLF